ncbi:GDSL-type esterase/lipase family protein [Serratia proteamaculans]|uniref:GDSL-type esterase/lipase family protein n=1 Tax=Serratia proteamaculans TaxID=28151 RepID=UPI0021789F3E|nr:GDSL-type esterase/lipase family protein [Serratia proteamaculans]CAI1577637.1 Prophage tail fibre N-terminal [Serratia proteamaculans]
MSILVEGTLLSPAGHVIGNADIVLTSISTSLVVLGGTPLSIQTDPAGRYSFTLSNGNYAVSVSKDGNNWFSGMITVTDLTVPKSINALILQDAMMAEIPSDYWSYFQAQTGILFTSFGKIDEAVSITTSSKDIVVVARDEAVAARDSAKVSADIAQNVADANTYYITESDADGTIAGLAGTESGKFFRVGLGAGKGFKYYLNNEGVAIEVSESVGADVLERVINKLPEINGRLASNATPLISINEDVVLWLNNGKIDSLGVGEKIMDSLKNNIVQTNEENSLADENAIPLLTVNNDVVLWLKNGKLESLALGQNLLSSLGPRAVSINEDHVIADTSKIPLIMVGNEVVLWLDHGKLCTMDLQLEGAGAFSPQLTQRFLPAFSSGASLYRWKAKCAVLDNGGNATAKIAFTGDSWTDFGTIPQQFANALYAKYGKSSDGWASVAGNNPQRDMYMNGMGLTRSAGWVNWAIGNPETKPPPFGGSPDGYCMYTRLSTCSATLSSVEGSQIDIYHRDSGTFRYRVDGGTWNVVTTRETSAMVKTSISGLADGMHIVDIDTTGNISVVAIYAFRPHSPRKKGVEVLKVGHAGARGLHYTYQVSPYIQPYAIDLDPDVVVIILGTNDYRNANSNTANYIDGIASIIDAYRAAHADVGIILVAPADTNGYQVSAPLIDFVTAARTFAVQAGIEFIDLHAMMPKWAVGSNLGMWEDSLHMSASGAQFLFNIVKDKLL